MLIRINDTRIEHTASKDGDEVAGLWDDAKEEFNNCFVTDQFGNCVDFEERIPAVPEDGGTFSADFAMEAQPFEMASTEGNQAPMIHIEIHKLEVPIDYPDFNFDSACS